MMVVMMCMGRSRSVLVFCVVMVLSLVVVNMEKGKGEVEQLRMDMRLVSSGMVMVEGAGLRQPKGQEKGPNQGKDKIMRLSFSPFQECHAALALLSFFSPLLSTNPGPRMDAGR